jgi:hypothetical protein
MARDPELFESAWLKWSWAVTHTDALQSYMAAWRIDPQPRVALEGRYDAKQHRIDIHVVETQPLPVEWGLVVGDIAHNYRSCLDHIAWALVTRGRTPPASLASRQRSKVIFPIYLFRSEFNKSLRDKLPGVRRADIAVVRRYQPYHEWKRRRANHLLAVLHRLSNDDKHRSVQPALTAPRAAMYDIGKTRDCLVTRVPTSFTLSEPLQVGTKLAPIYVRKTGPNPNIQMKGQLAAEPSIQGVYLEEWLDAMPQLVTNLLGELSDQPTKLLAKLGGVVLSG